MKTFRYITIVLLATVVLFSCEEEEFIEPTVFSDVGFYTSLFRTDITDGGEYNVAINRYLSFSDLSVNALEHSWSISDGSYFVKGPLTRNDSIFDDKRIHVGDTSTTDKTVNVVFGKGGWAYVTMRNIFTDSVAFRGHDTIPGIQQLDGTWLYEHTFPIKVYDTLAASAKIFQNGIEISPDVDTIFVENGNTLEFVDFTTNEPNTWRFSIGSAIGVDSASSISLKNLGTFTARLNVSRQGENIPNDYDNFVFPQIIKVIPSSLPFELTGEIVELKDETIQVPFNGGFEDFFIGQDEFIDVSVNGAPFSIASLSLNSEDASILEIKLSEPIYKGDVITISLKEGSNIRAADTREPITFENVSVKMYDHSLVDNAVYGFEVNGASAVELHPDNTTGSITVTDEIPGADGSQYSLKLESSEDGNWAWFSTNPSRFNIPEGTVLQYEYKFYIPSSQGANPFVMNGPWLHFSDESTWQQWWTNGVSTAPFDEWVTLTHPNVDRVTSKTDDYFMSIRLNRAGVIYYDDLRVYEYEARP